MPEFGGSESFTPGEGGGAASEGVSESAKQRFAQAQQQIKQIIRDEKKAKKRDDRVVETIRQFLGDDKYAHLFQLISRLAARDCPSVFILAILSLIHEGSLQAVEEFIAEQGIRIDASGLAAAAAPDSQGLPPEMREKLILWSSRMELVLNIDPQKILSRLMVDAANIDGSLLQFTTFVLVDFFELAGKPIPYDDLQPLTVKILQDIIQPHMEMMEKYFEEIRLQAEGPKEEE